MLYSLKDSLDPTESEKLIYSCHMSHDNKLDNIMFVHDTDKNLFLIFSLMNILRNNYLLFDLSLRHLIYSCHM